MFRGQFSYLDKLQDIGFITVSREPIRLPEVLYPVFSVLNNNIDDMIRRRNTLDVKSFRMAPNGFKLNENTQIHDTQDTSYSQRYFVIHSDILPF